VCCPQACARWASSRSATWPGPSASPRRARQARTGLPSRATNRRHAPQLPERTQHVVHAAGARARVAPVCTPHLLCCRPFESSARASRITGLCAASRCLQGLNGRVFKARGRARAGPGSACQGGAARSPRRPDADGGAEHQPLAAGAGQRHLRAHAERVARAVQARARLGARPCMRAAGAHRPALARLLRRRRPRMLVRHLCAHSCPAAQLHALGQSVPGWGLRSARMPAGCLRAGRAAARAGTPSSRRCCRDSRGG